jgi:hypothetical protein
MPTKKVINIAILSFIYKYDIIIKDSFPTVNNMKENQKICKKVMAVKQKEPGVYDQLCGHG